jgi:uncharacterized phage-associated protein
MPHSSLSIANEFIRRAAARNKHLTHMQVQKLVFFAHGFQLAMDKGPLIEESFEAWQFGPVVRRLYDALKRHGSKPIPRPIRWGDDTPFASDDDGEAFEPLDADDDQLINVVFAKFGHLQAFQLSALTHAPGTPWEKVYDQSEPNRVIPDEEIRSYFVNLVHATARPTERV